jgi:hypothetical protein
MNHTTGTKIQADLHEVVSGIQAMTRVAGRLAEEPRYSDERTILLNTAETAATLVHKLADRTSTFMIGAEIALRAEVEHRSTREFLVDLSERLRNVPVMYGVDGGDIDRLITIAGNL